MKNRLSGLRGGLGAASLAAVLSSSSCGDTYNTTNEQYYPGGENGNSGQNSPSGVWTCAFDVDTGEDFADVIMCSNGESYISNERCKGFRSGSWEGAKSGTVQWDGFECDWNYSSSLSLDCGEGKIPCEYENPLCQDSYSQCE